MSYDPSVSLQGLRRAASLLEQAARNIARPPSKQPAESAPADRFERSGEAQSVPDYPRELIRMLEAKSHWQANLRALKTGVDTDREVLEVLD
jgi:hypothetical protein